MAIRTYIVDDEALARGRIRHLLEGDPDVEVCGESADGEHAINAIQDLKPDLVFLDVEMPGTDGFGVLKALSVGADLPDEHSIPVVIFVTAYDRYAVEAFTVCALDFLLKPFNRSRFQRALLRAKTALRSREMQVEFRKRLLSLLGELRNQSGASNRIVVKVDGKHIFLPMSELRWIEAEGDYARLHVEKRSYLIRERMNAVESKLDNNRFVRIHRSTIVNLEHVVQASPGIEGDYILRLDDGTDLSVSRSYRSNIKKVLAQAL